MHRTAGKQPKPKTDCFTWTDDEVELLLKATNTKCRKYKVQKRIQSAEEQRERRLGVIPVEVSQDRSEQERSQMDPSVRHFGYSRSSGLAPRHVYLDDVTVFR